MSLYSHIHIQTNLTRIETICWLLTSYIIHYLQHYTTSTTGLTELSLVSILMHSNGRILCTMVDTFKVRFINSIFNVLFITQRTLDPSFIILCAIMIYKLAILNRILQLSWYKWFYKLIWDITQKIIVYTIVVYKWLLKMTKIPSCSELW